MVEAQSTSTGSSNGEEEKTKILALQAEDGLPSGLEWYYSTAGVVLSVLLELSSTCNKLILFFNRSLQMMKINSSFMCRLRMKFQESFLLKLLEGFWSRMGNLSKVLGQLYGKMLCVLLKASSRVRLQLASKIILILVLAIPKGVGAQTTKEFRPISLCNESYKIIAKILAGRFRQTLMKIISPHQSAFLPRRQIIDNCALALESIKTLMTQSSKKKFCAPKIDLSKVLNRQSLTKF